MRLPVYTFSFFMGTASFVFLILINISCTKNAPGYRQIYYLKLNTTPLASQFKTVLAQAVSNGTIGANESSQYYVADFYIFGRWSQCYGFNDTVAECSRASGGYTFQPTNAINATLPPQLSFGNNLPSDIVNDVVLFKELGYILFSFVFLSTFLVGAATFFLLVVSIFLQHTRFYKICVFLTWFGVFISFFFIMFACPVDTILFYRAKESFVNSQTGSGSLGAALWFEWISLIIIFLTVAGVCGGCCYGLGTNKRGPAFLVGGPRPKPGSTVVKTTDGSVRKV